MSDELKNEWLSHEYTKHLQNEALKRREVALTTLVGACAKSDDPHIRGLYQAFIDATEHQKLFQRGK